MIKSKIRKKILIIRKNNKINFKLPFLKIYKEIKKNILKKKLIGGYYPVNFELNILNILEKLENKGLKLSLPIVKKIMKWTFIAGHLKNYYK